VLAGVVLNLQTSSRPTFRADHTVIDIGRHRLSMEMISGARYQITKQIPAAARPAFAFRCSQLDEVRETNRRRSEAHRPPI